MPELRRKSSFGEKCRLRRGQIAWEAVALVWASGVIAVLILWGLLGNGKPLTG